MAQGGAEALSRPLRGAGLRQRPGDEGCGAGHREEGKGRAHRPSGFSRPWLLFESRVPLCSLVTHTCQAVSLSRRQREREEQEKRAQTQPQEPFWKTPCSPQRFLGIPGNFALWFCPPWGSHIFPMHAQIAG